MATTSRLAALGAAAVLLGGLLAGCATAPTATRHDGFPVEASPTTALPADFPRDEVPLIKGDVASVQKSGAKDPGYAVAILTDANRAVAVGKAVALLVGAGWKAKPTGRGFPSPVQVLTQGARQVIITNTTAGGQTLISYAIDLPS